MSGELDSGIVHASEESLDLSWLTPSLALGGRIPAGAACRLAEEHWIRRVIDLRAEEQDDAEEFRCQGIEVLLLPVPDAQSVPLPQLDAGVFWAREALLTGGRVLVHCQHGIGRSALMALCILVAQGLSPLAAMEHIKRVRSRVSPTPDQLKTFLDWTHSHLRLNALAPTDVTLTALAAVAWARET